MAQADISFDYPDRSPGFLLWQVTNLWQKIQRKALSELNLTHVQCALLAGIGFLENRKETVNQAALSKHVGADVMMTSQVIRTLETKGLVQRERGISDPRAFSLSLTEKGRALSAEALKIVEQVDGRFFDCINKHKRNLVDVLNSLKVNENGI